MGRDTNKIYNKAVVYYQDGQLTKALEQCERGISLDLKNSSLLNLKGVLLYLNGELQEAIAVWKINSHYNNDEISKVYIKDAKNDEDRLKLFFEAENNIKELQIDAALQKLKKCATSDFNSIRVNNGFAICYLRKGEFDIAREFNEKSLSIDKNNSDSIAIRNELNSLNSNPSNEYKSKIIKVVIVLMIITITSIASVKIYKTLVNNKSNDKIDAQVEKENDVIAETSDELEATNSMEEEVIVEELSDEEIQNLYVVATELFDNKEYDKAIENLEKAYNTSNESYLKEHVVFLLASSYENNKNDEKGIKYYEEYIEKYKSDNYIEEVYYKLATLYSESDKNKSKEYAMKLKEEYPKSIYVNSIIDEIISN